MSIRRQMPAAGRQRKKGKMPKFAETAVFSHTGRTVKSSATVIISISNDGGLLAEHFFCCAIALSYCFFVIKEKNCITLKIINSTRRINT